MYKILTTLISKRIYSHLQNNNILPEEQKGCRKKSRGCKDQLLISQMVMQHAKKFKKDLYFIWIDYKKAFDNIPHSLIKQILETYKIKEVVRNFIECPMFKWKTTMILISGDGCLKTGAIFIKREMFHGDSLSPLPFCMTLTPLSNALRKKENGYIIHEQISHVVCGRFEVICCKS